MWRTLAAVGALLALGGTAVAQGSAGVSGPAVVEAGETVTLVVILDRAPNFDGGDIGIVVVGPDYNVGPGVRTISGQKQYRISFSIPPDAPSATWYVRSVTFGAGMKGIPLKFPGFSFQVVAHPGLIYPTSAQIEISLSQAQLLRSEAMHVQSQIQEVKAKLVGLDNLDAEVANILSKNISQSLDSLASTESTFIRLGSEDAQKKTAEIFFDDLRKSYQDALAETRRDKDRVWTHGSLNRVSLQSVPHAADTDARYSLLALAGLRAFEQNELAYNVVADTRSLTFDLDVRSNPSDARVSYRRRGDTFTVNGDPTDTVIKKLPYAIWIVRFEKRGFKTQDREHDPFRESNHIVIVNLNR
jgi:hypothetical protein